MKRSTYYEGIKSDLIDRYKILVEQCFDIMEKDIDDKITDDKLHNVLKAKRMASEDAKFYAKEIESLENESNGIDAVDPDKPVNPLKKFTKK